MRRSIIFIMTVILIAILTQNSIFAVTTQDLSTKTARDLAQSLVGIGITISNVTFTGANVAAGSFAGGVADGLSIESGVILSSGDIADAKGPDEEDGKSTTNDQEGDTDLESLIGKDTHDAAVLEFDFIPKETYFSFLYIFASEEYNEYVGSEFNDVFAFFLDGVNIALIPLSDQAVSINNVNLNKNSDFYNNNDPGDLGTPTPKNTQFDGFTSILWAQGLVTPGTTHHIKLAIADVSDFIFDSAVFIASGSFSSTIPAISVSHSSHAFGDVGLGGKKSETFTISNVGEGDLTLGSIKITGSDAGEFTIQNNTCPVGTLGPSEICTFDVDFSPTTTADKFANIQIISNDFDTPKIDVELSGTGVIFISLKTHNGSYLCALNGGGDNVAAYWDTLGNWERFAVKILGNNKIILKTYNGNYVNAIKGGGENVVAQPMTNWGPLHTARGNIRLIEVCGGMLCWENFSVISLGNNKVALRTFYGYYVTAIGGGGGDVVSNSTVIGDYETFEVIFLDQ